MLPRQPMCKQRVTVHASGNTSRDGQALPGAALANRRMMASRTMCQRGLTAGIWLLEATRRRVSRRLLAQNGKGAKARRAGAR